MKRQNQELARLDQLNSLIRQIDQVLVQANTVTGIDQSVCEQLADSDLFEFAWIGEFDAIGETIEPRQWAGINSTIIEDRTITIDDSTTNQNPVAATVATRDTQVVADIATDRRTGSCREAILEEGARSCISIPLLYEETLYGVLTVYIGQPKPNERNQQVMDELGRTISHAIHAAQKQETTQTDSVVELTLQFQKPGTVLARLAQDAAVQLQFKGIVPTGNGSSHVFFTGDRTSVNEIQDAGTNLSGVSALTCVAEHDERCMYKATVSTSPIVSQLATQKGTVRTLTFDRNTTVAVVDLPSAVDVRGYIDDLQRTYSSVQLTSRRSCDRSPESVQDVQMAIKEPLTDRQAGVLKLAYLSGFFKSPRENNGQEIADMLDVSPPTFTQHLRAAQQKVFALAFEEE
ncbi:bacterio-opsin activator domain-containing protein [Haladaptatus sp. DFWS20]|uniref:bacterio-opsin activator domain-containing protein n=1 Tax=Haladaptatus sp. DFWS20 TaxID=3403467 RepID=UPI003EBEA07C